MPNDVYSARANELPVATGIAREDLRELAHKLGGVLASTYVLYHKTHAYHWNVTGPLFYSVHKLTDAQYQDLAAAIEEIAERTRALGFAAPVGLSGYIKESVVKDVSGVPSAGDMVAELADDHQAVAVQLRNVVDEAETVDDVFTADLLTARIGVHEEAAWMLNALLVDASDGSSTN